MLYSLPLFSVDNHVFMFFLLQWLEEKFLPYLDKWESSVEERKGFKRAQKNRTLISSVTLTGLRITGRF